MTQEFEHAFWRPGNRSTFGGLVLQNAAKRGITQEMRRLWKKDFLLMIPIFKQNGLIWTLLDTSNISNISLYSFDST